jgi:hypothetical protein
VLTRFRNFTSAAYWPRVMVLSAQHGLVSEHTWLEPYDQRMTARRAIELADADLCEVTRRTSLRINRGQVDNFGPYAEAFVFGGRLYRNVIEAWRQRGLFRDALVRFASGVGIGEMLHDLKCWLAEAAS